VSLCLCGEEVLSKRKQNPLVLELFEFSCNEAIEPGWLAAVSAIFGCGLQNLQQCQLPPEISLVQFLAQNGFIDFLQF
jgi:hypothetical protein